MSEPDYNPDYNNPTQEMIDSIGQGSLPSDIERDVSESLLRRLSEYLGVELPES